MRFQVTLPNMIILETRHEITYASAQFHFVVYRLAMVIKAVHDESPF